MIDRKIKVEYLRRREDSKIGLTYEDLAKPGQAPWEVDAIDLSETFTKFTNGVGLARRKPRLMILSTKQPNANFLQWCKDNDYIDDYAVEKYTVN